MIHQFKNGRKKLCLSQLHRYQAEMFVFIDQLSKTQTDSVYDYLIDYFVKIVGDSLISQLVLLCIIAFYTERSE